MELIDKDALVAEIEKRKIPFKRDVEDGYYPTYLCALMDFEDFLDTLEVKEVDLEKEVKEEYLNHRCYGGKNNMLVILNEPQFNKIAKHFFELGLKARKGE